MTDFAPHSSQRFFDRMLTRMRNWTYGAVFLSLLICAAIATTHIYQHELLQSLAAHQNALKQGRIDLAKGSLYIGLSDLEDAPFDRAQGMALLQQALDELASALEHMDPSTASQANIDFRKDIAAMADLLEEIRTSTPRSPVTAIRLRIQLSNLERWADLVDSQLRTRMQQIDARYDRVFVMLLVVAVLLLSGVCGIVFAAVRGGREATRRLRESEGRYRELFMANPHPMWVYDVASLAFLAVNDAAVANYGYTRGEFLTMTIRDIRPQDQSAELDASVHSIPGPMRRVGIWTHRWKDGTLRRVEIATHDLMYDGRPARLTLANDVTERLAAEDQIRQLNEELERKVEERTRELEESATELEVTNDTLRDEIAERLSIEENLLATTVELQAKNAELERMNRLFVGRELRMRELKEELARLRPGSAAQPPEPETHS